MKLSTFFAVTSASSSLVLAHPIANASPAELYTVELEPGVTRQVTEEEKWALRRVKVHRDHYIYLTLYRKAQTSWT